MTVNKLGKLSVGFGRYPEPHEIKTVELFILRGIDVEFLPENRTEGMKSADVLMNGVIWELK